MTTPEWKVLPESYTWARYTFDAVEINRSSYCPKKYHWNLKLFVTSTGEPKTNHHLKRPGYSMMLLDEFCGHKETGPYGTPVKVISGPVWSTVPMHNQHVKDSHVLLDPVVNRECNCNPFKGSGVAYQLPSLLQDRMDFETLCPDPRGNSFCKSETTSLWWQIQHLNDDHKWSREEIADWLDTLDIDLTFPVP